MKKRKKREEKRLEKKFLLCGAIGLCMEVCFTGLEAFLQKDFRCMGKSSILMFPIYGLASVIGPVSLRLKKWSRGIRGIVYTAGIFAVEFCSGSFLRYFGICPWDYSECRFHVRGLIRLDFAPLWFAAGLFFEKILSD